MLNQLYYIVLLVQYNPCANELHIFLLELVWYILLSSLQIFPHVHKELYLLQYSMVPFPIFLRHFWHFYNLFYNSLLYINRVVMLLVLLILVAFLFLYMMFLLFLLIFHILLNCALLARVLCFRGNVYLQVHQKSLFCL